ncbi:MAG: hypothetical protein U9Q06_04445 [Nanoarchaeota archaeon]|nr:hypothetical protein [Nanoarchaeota archaeon]
MKKLLIVGLIGIFVVISFLIFYTYPHEKESIILTDPIEFSLTENEVGSPYYLNTDKKGLGSTGYIEKEDNQKYIVEYGLIKGYTQLFSDSDLYVNISEPLSDADSGQKFLIYTLGITILNFDSIEGAQNYYDYILNLSFKMAERDEDMKSEKVSCKVGDVCNAGYNFIEDRGCYFEDCNQNIYWLAFRNRNIFVMINRNIGEPTSEIKIIEWAKIINSKIR